MRIKLLAIALCIVISFYIAAGTAYAVPCIATDPDLPPPCWL